VVAWADLSAPWSGSSKPFVAVHHIPATERPLQHSYCHVGGRLFDPATLSWRFDGEAYVERLQGLRAAAG